MTTRSVHRDGRVLYVDMSFALVHESAGHVVGAVAVGRDMTDRFQADKNARKRRAELEAQVKRLTAGG